MFVPSGIDAKLCRARDQEPIPVGVEETSGRSIRLVGAFADTAHLSRAAGLGAGGTSRPSLQLGRRRLFFGRQGCLARKATGQIGIGARACSVGV